MPSQSHKITRNNTIDIMRGICAFSVIFIHTTFWSGDAYVPKIIQSLSLIIDVPIFFFIAGATIAYTNRIEVLNVLFKMIFYFGGVVILLDTATSLYRSEFSFSDTISVLKLNAPKTPLLPGIGGSYWFVPVFCMVSIMGGIILKFTRFSALPLLVVSAVVYVSAYFGGIGAKILDLGLSYHLFYLGLYLLGFYIFKSRLLGDTRFLLTLVFFSAISFLLLFICAENPQELHLQGNKFPPKLPYIIVSFGGIGICGILANLLSKSIQTQTNRTRIFGGFCAGVIDVFSFAGKNAMLFYLAQGISSSLLLHIAPKIHIYWALKLTCCFVINVILCCLFVWALSHYFRVLELVIAKFNDLFGKFGKLETTKIPR